MVDFVEEVEERLRAERYATLSRRLAPWFAAALVLIIAAWLGMWGWQTLQARDVGRASVAYDKALHALEGGDQTGAFTQLQPLAKSGPAGYRTLALMQQGDMRLGADKGVEAAGFYDAAAKTAPNAIFRDLARLRAAQALMDTAPLAQLEPRLKPLIGANKPFDLQAREALAIAHIEAGQLQLAKGELTALSLSLGVSPTTRARAQTAIGLINSGDAKLIGPVAHAAATMAPSASTIPKELLPSGAGDGQPGEAAPQGDSGTDQ